METNVDPSNQFIIHRRVGPNSRETMAYVTKSGTVSNTKPLLRRLQEFIRDLFNLVLLFFKTILDPQAAQLELERRRKRQERASGVKLGGSRGGSGAGRPRVIGLSDFKDAGGNCAAGA